ncbi:MAG TPA: SDR family NAD(P)-dependent oxidoreductase [Candidatus Acidoferrales bacterium]|nr:SDR family NAD(P)-dependent oxidoreductase [Candidatus Acidoferrales bacterium]
MQRLSGKAAFITGGGTGIGRACALLFAQEGAKVAIAARRREKLDAVAAEISAGGGQALAVECDVTRKDSVELALRATEERFGGVHVVVNNAGAVHVGTAEETSDDAWERTISANLTGTFYVSRAALPVLRRAGGGSIVNIGSYLGLVALKQRVAYCAAKGGVTLLTKAMALDHAHENIRVNCICPAIVETEMAKASISSAPDPAAYRKARESQIPLGRMGHPEDIAHLALFLASDESSWITGTAFPIDGGLTAY